MQDQPAAATVKTSRKGFGHFRSAARALLACPAGIYFDHSCPGPCSLGLEGADKAGPAGISDRLGQSAVPEHLLDIQALHSNQAVAIQQRIRNLERMLPAQVSDPGNAFVEVL